MIVAPIRADIVPAGRSASSATTLRTRLDALRSARGLPASDAAPIDPPRSALSDLPGPIAQTLSPTLAERLARLRPWTVGDRHTEVDESEVARQLGGECIAPGVIRIARSYPLPLDHGRASLRPTVDGVPALFIDTETNGLAGGTGTIAFVIGLAQIDGARCSLIQWLLTAFSGERAMLDDLSAGLAAMPANAKLYTYNGASFDLPLLHTRLRLHGLADPLHDLSHSDLLHWAKRARPEQWPDARLHTVEQRGLGFERIDDLPGAAVPGAWQTWLRAGDPRPLAKVLEHNRNDLLSLAALREIAQRHPDARTVRRDARQPRLFESATPWPALRRTPSFVRAPFGNRAAVSASNPQAAVPKPQAAVL